MKNIQNWIEKFNQPETHLVVSEWPSRDSKVPHHGVAAFTRETLLTLSRDHNMRFVVLAEKNVDNSPQLAGNGKILVLRVFDHTHISLYPVILRWLVKFPAIRHVTVHSEFGAYSGIRHFALVIPFLALIKLMGRNITYMAHNVIDSVNFLAQHLDITNPTTVDILNVGIKTYHNLLNVVADNIVVLDAHGKTILDKYILKDNLIYIPHWVKPRTTRWTKRAAKKLLGIPVSKKVLLSFGFVTWYKGADLLANLFTESANHHSSYHLIFAGGEAPSIRDSKHYQRYFKSFRTFTKENPNITLTGYIPEDKIGLYFAAADLVILPYRGLMGGSGAMAWTAGFGKPFLISDRMRPVVTNPDIREALAETRISANQLIFPLTGAGMKKILHTAGNRRVLRMLTRLSKRIREKRDIHSIGNTFYNKLYASSPTPNRRISWTLFPENIHPAAHR
jgi:glycosyltransferase involved in cell wall biosynthesis